MRIEVLTVFMALSLASLSVASDLAIYSVSFETGWISSGNADATVTAIAENGEVNNLFEQVDRFTDADGTGDDSLLGKWITDHTGNGQADVIILASGIAPTALYPADTRMTDGSKAENFIDAGNLIVNITALPFFVHGYSYKIDQPDVQDEHNRKSLNESKPWAGVITDIFDMDDFEFSSQNGVDGFDPWVEEPGVGGREMTKITAEGEFYLPALQPFRSHRFWELSKFDDNPNWTAVAFATTEDGQYADPVVVYRTEKGTDGFGMFAGMWQTEQGKWNEAGTDPRASGVAQFLTKWWSDNSQPVDPQGKTLTTWGSVKNRD